MAFILRAAEKIICAILFLGMTLLGFVNVLVRYLTEAQTASDAELKKLSAGFEAEQRTFMNRMVLIEDAEGMDAVRSVGEQLVAYGAGGGGLFALRGADVLLLGTDQGVQTITR